MAVIIKYIVVRNGDEKMTFATKKEADEYDKMLDIADNILEFLEESKLGLEEKQLQDMSLYMTENRNNLINLLKGSRPKKKTSPVSSIGSSVPKIQSESKAQGAKQSKEKTDQKNL